MGISLGNASKGPRPDQSAAAIPCSMIRWGVFAVALDIAALIHGFIVIWIVLTYNREWAYWDAQMAGLVPGVSLDDVRNDSMPAMLFLTLTWAISIAAASLAWLQTLRAP